MSVQQFNPSTDTDLFIYTVDPAWSTESINTDFEQPLLDAAGNPVLDEHRNPVLVFSFWHSLRFIKRDLRLGNIDPKIDAIEWMEMRVQLAQNLLMFRGGAFKRLAPMALAPVIAILELSQSRKGFVRKNFRTFSFKSENEDKSRASGGFFGRR